MNAYFAAHALDRDSQWDRFLPFSGLHFLTVGVCVLLIVTIAIVGHWLHRRAESRMRYALALFAISVAVVSVAVP